MLNEGGQKLASARERLRKTEEPYQMTELVECKLCIYKTKYSHNMERHRRAAHEGKKFKCKDCGKEFTFQNNLKRHSKKMHESLGVDKEKAGV